MESKNIVIAGIAGVGIWYLWQQGYLASWFGPSFGPTPSLTPSGPGATSVSPVQTSQPPAQSQPPASSTTQQPPRQAPPPAQVLNVADAAQYPYSPSVTSAQMLAIHDQLVTELQGGQIPQIAGNSVVAYMLGWGGAAAGQTQTVLGDTYKFDGTNWNLIATPGMSGYPEVSLASARVPIGLAHYPDDIVAAFSGRVYR